MPGEAYSAFTPDILLKDDASVPLDAYGIDGVARHTPGHTAGSISVELRSGDALVGDLIASGVLLGGVTRLKHATRPPFEDDPQAISGQLLGMVEAGMQRFYMGHGGPLPAAEVRRHARYLAGLQPGRSYALHADACDCAKRPRVQLLD